MLPYTAICRRKISCKRAVGCLRRVRRSPGVENRRVPKVFSPRTLGKFEDASASIPLRPLCRAFDAVGIRLGADPGGAEGARKVQFRRYVAGVDQHDPQQLARLGEALGTLIDEVATSKQQFLVTAAEGDGFSFADGVFRPATENPEAAIAKARALLESVCRTILNQIGERPPAKTAGLDAIVKSTLKALAPKKR
jgi:hypothetical protein